MWFNKSYSYSRYGIKQDVTWVKYVGQSIRVLALALNHVKCVYKVYARFNLELLIFVFNLEQG